MALDQNALATALKATFAQGLSDPAWTEEDAAEALAAAIHSYVSAAEVVGVTTDVSDAASNPLGTGTQTGTGTLT